MMEIRIGDRIVLMLGTIIHSYNIAYIRGKEYLSLSQEELDRRDIVLILRLNLIIYNKYC